eukprot:1160479-Pelagomonas_calceolata.AAC.19
MGIWKVTGSTRLQNLAVRSVFVLNSTPSGNKFVDVFNMLHGHAGLQGVGLQPKNLADRLLVQHYHPASKIETNSDKKF